MSGETMQAITPGLTHPLMQALRFGEKCASVKTTAQGGVSGLAALIAALDNEIAACEAEIESKERWERMQHVVPVDEFGDGGGVREYSVLVGAEEERERLEGLLARRRELLGEAIAEVPAAGKEEAGEGKSQGEGGIAAKLRAASKGTVAPELAALKREKEQLEQPSVAPKKKGKFKIPARFAARMAKGGADGASAAEEEKAKKLAEKMEKAEARKKKLDEEKQAKARAQGEKVKAKMGITTGSALRAVTNIRRSPSTPLQKPSGWDDEPVRLGGDRMPTETCNSRSGHGTALGGGKKAVLQPLQAKVSRWPSPLTVIQKGVPLAAVTLGASPTKQ